MKNCENALERLPVRYAHTSRTIPEISAEEFGFRAGWRQALETIKKELEYPTNLDGIDAFIDEELNE